MVPVEEPIPITDLRGNAFKHGLPLHAAAPTAWCTTAYPSLYCQCGACRITWAEGPAGTPAAPVATWTTGTRFTHAAVPRDGTGALCTTDTPQTPCACGAYTIAWELPR